MKPAVPLFPGPARKNDALFMYGAVRPKPFVFAYEQSAKEIVCGPACRQEREIIIDACRRDNVPVGLRRGGGGTVVLSPGMAIIIAVGRRKTRQWADSIFPMVHDAMIEALSGLCPAPIEKQGTSDLAVNGRKILGSSLYLGNRPYLYYYQASLMVDPDLTLLGLYLEHPPREPVYRKGRGHEEFCTTLRAAGYDLTTAETCALIERRLPRLLLNQKE
jgi:lipoate-protein ligase A